MSKDKKKAIKTLITTVILAAIAFFVVIVGIPKDGWSNKDKFIGNAKNIILGLDLQGGASITYEVEGDYDSQDLDDTITKLQQRVEGYSTEASVYKEGDNRIVVDIPGVTDQNEVFEKLSEVGTVEFQTEDGTVVVDGNDIADAQASVRQENATTQNVVDLKFTGEGKTKFAKATSENIGKAIKIMYNGEELSSPRVNSAIEDGNAQITGSFTKAEAENLASFIRIGALPTELKALRSSTVGAQLGSEALSTSVKAGIIGFILVIIFMIALYRVPGVAASVALTIYVGIVMLALNILDITLTLPGIAGIILSVGMAVDANVIIFTRIKEEIGAGKSVKTSIENGFDKALSAILDGNITTLIAAVVLGWKGSGTVKGFAYTLGIGIVVSMFTALFVTKRLMWALFYLGANKESLYGKKGSDVKKFRFVENKVKYFIISGVVILAGIGAMIWSYRDNGEIFAYSLEFKGGTSMEIEFKNNEVPSNADIEKLFNDAGLSEVNVAPVKDTKKVVVKTVDLSNELETKEKIQSALNEQYKVENEDIQEEIISATVSTEMKKNAIVAVSWATVAMLIYIWFRFKKLSFALGSVIPLIHDVLIVVSIYALLQIQVGNTFIACLLTLVGYSINATIVIFDRIRESKAAIKTKEDKKKLVNDCISQTLTRSINTSLTTFIMVFVLYIMGVASIKDFTLPLMAGIICGAYSSVCIAGTVWFLLDKGKGEKKISKEDRKIKESKDKVLV